MLSKGCPICGGDVYTEVADYGVIEHRCFQAGHLVSDEHVQKVVAERAATKQEKKEVIMVEIKDMNINERGRYIKEHLAEIKATKAAPATKPEKKSAPEPERTAPLTEHEQYLILLGYQQATREFLKYLK